MWIYCLFFDWPMLAPQLVGQASVPAYQPTAESGSAHPLDSCQRSALVGRPRNCPRLFLHWPAAVAPSPAPATLFCRGLPRKPPLPTSQRASHPHTLFAAALAAKLPVEDVPVVPCQPHLALPRMQCPACRGTAITALSCSCGHPRLLWSWHANARGTAGPVLAAPAPPDAAFWRPESIFV